MSAAGVDVAEADVVIVGAGPAGCAAAIELRRRERRVVVLEKARHPRHKICGDFLTPGSVARLRELGVEAVALEPVALRGMRITFEGVEVPADFPGTRDGWSLSRRSLDAALARRAVEAGAQLVEEIRVVDFGREPDGARWVEGLHPDGARRRWRAGLLVEAGGRHGLIGRRLGYRVDDARLRRYALWSHLEGVRGLCDRGEMHVFDGGYAGVAPLPGRVDRGAANVTMVLTAEGMRAARADPRRYFLRRLRQHPELGRRLESARFLAPLRGTGPLACRARRMFDDGLAMIGDSCGFVDPFTGEGVFLALESARLMSVAHEAGMLPRYESDWRAAFGSKLALCRLLQVVIARPWLARRVARALSARKDLADRMVGATGDLLPASSVLNLGYIGRLLLAGMTA